MTWARSPTASTTAVSRSVFSASVVVGDSPVVPLTTSASLRCSSTRWVASFAAPSTSREPSGANGVTMAVNSRPKGRGSCVIPTTYRTGRSDVESGERGPGQVTQHAPDTPDRHECDHRARTDGELRQLPVEKPLSGPGDVHVHQKRHREREDRVVPGRGRDVAVQQIPRRAG